MALAAIRREIVLTLADTNEALREARTALACGGFAEKVAAAGDIDFLSRQQRRLQQRLLEIDKRAAERHTLFSWHRHIWFSLMLQMESWIAHG